jgi:hypothetical protein
MESFKEYLVNEAKDRSSNKVQAISTLVDAIKSALDQYDISTRHFVWEHLNSPKGKELMSKVLRNPKTYLSDSEFTKLVEKKH